MVWKQKGAPSAASDPKITEISARTVEKTALKPVVTLPLPPELNPSEKELSELPDYIPPLDLQVQRSNPFISPLTELQIF